MKYGRKFLNAYINGELIGKDDLYPIFRLVQELYSTAYAKLKGATHQSEFQILSGETNGYYKRHLCRGVSIGVIATKSVLLNDDHLSFPIIKVKEDDKPLWWVTLDWEDPKVERFDNCITVFLNKKFKTYPKSSKDAEFLCTIIASVYFLVIKKLKMQDGDIIRSLFNGSDEFEEFSVCAVMSHFCGMLQFLDFDKMVSLTDENLLAEIQKEINVMCGGALQ